VVASVVAVAGHGTPEAAASASGCPSSPALVGDALVVSCKWATFLPGLVFQSSPVVANLDGAGPSVVVGSRTTGQVYALHLADGSSVPGWPVQTGFAVDSSPTVIPDAGGSGLDDVAVDVGDVTSGPPASLGIDHGAMFEFAPDGAPRWTRALPDQFDGFGPDPAVYASPAAADVTGSGQTSLVAAGVSLSQYALDASGGATLAGWPQKTADSTFSSAAIADLDGGGRPVIVAGSDASAGPGALYNWDGGVVRAEDGFGNVLWVHRSDEVVTSSPAVGNLDGTGDKVVFGHGRYWADLQPSNDATAVTALDADGSVDWHTNLSGYTPASPALADLSGSPGELDAVEPTWMRFGQPDGGGEVYALGPHGNILWGPVSQTYVDGTQGNPADIYGGVATAALTPGFQDVVFGSTFGWNIIDGRTGSLLLPRPTTSGANLDGEFINWDGATANLNIQGTPLVTPDPLGGMDIVLAGTYAPANPSGDRGFVAVYRVTNADPGATGPGSWPMFHHDPQHSGATSPPALHCPGCVAGTGTGYWLTGADGGVFAFGDAGFYGSLGGVRLNAPVVGMAATPDGRGYVLVAADGGVFAFGDAGFYGSLGGVRLNAPVVGMAATPDGRGYVLVAADGGVFAFGDAGFYGSLGGVRLNAPVVGMAPTTDGLGYWLVAADGGVFAFGDAVYQGSMGGQPLAQPVVGMTTIPGAGGYWLVAADGGVFAFGAPFYGSMGGRFLSRPVVSMGSAPPEAGGGYWEVGADGGVFAFGQAPFRGSTGALALSAPVVAMVAAR
jgi:hypothetical protein